VELPSNQQRGPKAPFLRLPGISHFPNEEAQQVGSDRETMLNRALDALAEVLEARFEPSRLTKERAAVLSEMSMVNTIEYRVECAILEALHAENILSKRFPIGLKSLIEAWELEDVQAFHDTHYYPGNALLYIIGDLPVEQMERQLSLVMGNIPSSNICKA
jgi:predicted Zn-dependent peptidase